MLVVAALAAAAAPFTAAASSASGPAPTLQTLAEVRSMGQPPLLKP